MEKLYDIEAQIILEIIRENKKNYPFLEGHYQYLYVKNRESTGVGFYINFGYTNKPSTEKITVLLSSKKTLTVDGFENELAYVLDITNGVIDCLEIVTNGNDVFENEEDNYQFKLS